jgi:LysR family hydrogen peroxide-inducible transcriptional activator
MVAAIPFEEPAPARRVALAWRRSFARPQAIEAIVAAVASMRNPSYRLIEA